MIIIKIIFRTDISAKNSGMETPRDKIDIASSEAETINIALMILFAAIILDRNFFSACSCIAA